MSNITHVLGNPADRAIETNHSFRVRAQKIDSLLGSKGLTARLTVGVRSFVVGQLRSPCQNIVEFSFDSYSTYERLMENVRLYSFARAFFDEKLNIFGSLDDAMDILFAINDATDQPQSSLERLGSLSFRIAKAAIPYIATRFESDAHYSMNASAYRLFLDEHMQYTCAKFTQDQEDLNQAQINKFILIEELAKPYIGDLVGRRHLDIGCGWGGLISYFEKNFSTSSVGNTNNKRQRKYAEDHYGVGIILGDFTDLRQSTAQYDLITVVGMAEHLTPRRRSQLFKVIKHCLRAGGVVYFQCIAKPRSWIGGDAYRIAYDDVFPGHYVESREEMESRFRKLGYEILYAMDDANDYAKTTALWAHSLQLRRREMVDMIGERNFRIFLGYLAYGSKLFAVGRGSLMRYMLRIRQ